MDQIENVFIEKILVAGSAVNTFLLPITDVSRFKSFSLHLTGTFTASVQVQVGNDPTQTASFINQTLLSPNAPQGGFSTPSTTGVYGGPVCARYMQIQITAYTSGTVTGILELYSLPFSPNGPVIGAGNNQVTLGATTNQIGRLNPANTALVAAGTAANTVIKGTPGILYGVFASTTAAGGGQIFDNASTASGTPIAFAPAAIGYDTGIPAVGINCVNGITLQGSATNPALTIFFI